MVSIPDRSEALRKYHKCCKVRNCRAKDRLESERKKAMRRIGNRTNNPPQPKKKKVNKKNKSLVGKRNLIGG